jgi:hypothetical protein
MVQSSFSNVLHLLEADYHDQNLYAFSMCAPCTTTSCTHAIRSCNQNYMATEEGAQKDGAIVHIAIPGFGMWYSCRLYHERNWSLVCFYPIFKTAKELQKAYTKLEPPPKTQPFLNFSKQHKTFFPFCHNNHIRPHCNFLCFLSREGSYFSGLHAEIFPLKTAH